MNYEGPLTYEGNPFLPCAHPHLSYSDVNLFPGLMHYGYTLIPHFIWLEPNLLPDQKCSSLFTMPFSSSMSLTFFLPPLKYSWALTVCCELRVGTGATVGSRSYALLRVQWERPTHNQMERRRKIKEGLSLSNLYQRGQLWGGKLEQRARREPGKKKEENPRLKDQECKSSEVANIPVPVKNLVYLWSHNNSKIGGYIHEMNLEWNAGCCKTGRGFWILFILGGHSCLFSCIAEKQKDLIRMRQVRKAIQKAIHETIAHREL